MKHVLYGCFFVVLLIFGCNGPDNTEKGYPFVIDLDEAVENKIDYKLSTIFDSITYIPVESKDGFLFSGPFLIKISEHYIVYIAGTTHELLLFDRSGKFIRKIARRGKGPGEYNYVMDLAIDESGNIIYVVCNNNRKIFKYSLQGDFLGYIPLSRFTDMIEIPSSNTLLIHFTNWTGDLEYNWLLLTAAGDTVNKFKNNIFYKPEKRNVYEYEAIYYLYNNQLHVKDKCDTLFVMTENHTMLPKYVFKSRHQPEIIRTQHDFDDGKISIRYVRETDSHCFFEFRINGQWHNAYYDKEKRKAYSTSGVIINDLDDVDSYCCFGNQYNQAIIMSRLNEFDMDRFKNTVTDSKYQHTVKLFQKLTDEDPVMLIIMHLKNK